MKRTLLVGMIVVCLIFGIVAYANAAATTVNVTAAVNNVFSMNIAGSSVSFDMGALDPDVEVAAGTSPAITVKSNKPYSLSTKATDFSDGGTNTMAASKMSFAVSGDATVAKRAFSTSDYAITAAGARGVRTYTSALFLTPGWDTAPANYSGTITYTALQN